MPRGDNASAARKESSHNPRFRASAPEELPSAECHICGTTEKLSLHRIVLGDEDRRVWFCSSHWYKG